MRRAVSRAACASADSVLPCGSIHMTQHQMAGHHGLLAEAQPRRSPAQQQCSVQG